MLYKSISGKTYEPRQKCLLNVGPGGEFIILLPKGQKVVFENRELFDASLAIGFNQYYKLTTDDLLKDYFKGLGI